MTSDMVIIGTLAPWLRPLWAVAAGAGAAILVLLALTRLLRLLSPKVAAIARTTAKEGLTQPLFYLLVALGVLLLLTFPFIPYNTFGEDVKVLKDEGMTLIMLLGIVLALWTASVSVAEEIEGRTALTVLSKPIGRRQFIVGKFLGILGPVAILFVVLGAVFLATVSYKVSYDARETSNPDPTWHDCAVEMEKTAPGLALAFMETVVLTSISVAISTRLPMLPNLIICAAIYVLGHVVPMLLNSAVRQFEIVAFVARLFSTVLPVLDDFNVQAAISTGQRVPLTYLVWDGVYCIVYSTVAMLVALLLFEDRDLA
jgi:ABC-type transport system involved in multi-copper enzyme maturation permease subunit